MRITKLTKVAERAGAKAGEEVKLIDLQEGDHFGELALITREPRAATVTALTPVVLMALDRDAFHELLGPLAVRRDVVITRYTLTPV